MQLTVAVVSPSFSVLFIDTWCSEKPSSLRSCSVVLIQKLVLSVLASADDPKQSHSDLTCHFFATDGLECDLFLHQVLLDLLDLSLGLCLSLSVVSLSILVELLVGFEVGFQELSRCLYLAVCISFLVVQQNDPGVKVESVAPVVSYVPTIIS